MSALPAKKKKCILTFDEHIYSLTDDIKSCKVCMSLSCNFRSRPPGGVKAPPTSFCCKYLVNT